MSECFKNLASGACLDFVKSSQFLTSEKLWGAVKKRTKNRPIGRFFKALERGHFLTTKSSKNLSKFAVCSI